MVWRLRTGLLGGRCGRKASLFVPRPPPLCVNQYLVAEKASGMRGKTVALVTGVAGEGVVEGV